MNLLLEWNEKINLTAITEVDDIILKHFIDSMTVLKYIENGQTIGFIKFLSMYDRMEIENIEVLEEYRNNNIGTKLMSYLISIAIEEHAINITLEVRPSNEYARKLYKNFGFREVALRKYYYGDEDDDWYWTNQVVEGADSSELTTDAITEYTEYYCYVTDGYGNGQSVYFYVYVDNNFSAWAADSEDQYFRYTMYVEPNNTAVLSIGFLETYQKVYNSYLFKINRVKNEEHTKSLMLLRIKDMQQQKHITNYRIYTDLHLNPGNVNDFLTNGNVSKLSLKTAEMIYDYVS